MLRTAVARSRLGVGQRLRGGSRLQWLPRPAQSPLTRTFADERPVDKTVVPNSQTGTVAGVPQAPVQATVTSNPTQTDLPASPRTPPTPAEVGAKTPSSTGNVPPTGTGTASTGPAAGPPPPPPKRPRRRFRNFLLTLIVLSALGYAGGVYYSLVSDNFHDFFTEYVPYGEDAVAYFEEREFRRRFPSSLAADGATGSKAWPQTRGENKVTIGKSSGLTAKLAEEKEKTGSDLSEKGKHASAVGDNQKKTEEKKATARKDSKPTEQKKEGASKPRVDTKASQPEAQAKPAPTVAAIDHVNAPEAEEPVVQDIIKLVNNVITAVNDSSDARKLSPVVITAKEELQKAIAGISTLKEKAAYDADEKVKAVHSEFDEAAKELVRRLESEMQDQESRWRQEYEAEREKLSESYQQKLAAELDAAKNVSDQKNQNALLEQEVALQKKFIDSVKGQVEAEREGRLAKLDELSSSVAELERLTGEWNSVVDATLQTQHLQVALEAVRARLQESEFPVPFLDELVALKEVSRDDEVVNAAIASIPPIAYQRGVPSVASLIDRFRRVATEVRKASLLPEDAGVASHAASAVLSRLMFQKKSDRGLPAGDDVEATLARTEVLLEEGDLDAAAREMNTLKGWAGVLSKDWVSECRRVLEVRQAVDVIATEARLQSLLVD